MEQMCVIVSLPPRVGLRVLSLPLLACIYPHDQCQSPSHRHPPPSPPSPTFDRLFLLPTAQMFAPATKKTFREINFSILNGEEGGKEDRPLIIQFCGNDPQQILTSAKVLEPYCDAVDINLGCPQDIAKKGKYGAFLQDEWGLIYDISKRLSSSLPWGHLSPRPVSREIQSTHYIRTCPSP